MLLKKRRCGDTASGHNRPDYFQNLQDLAGTYRTAALADRETQTLVQGLPGRSGFTVIVTWSPGITISTPAGR